MGSKGRRRKVPERLGTFRSHDEVDEAVDAVEHEPEGQPPRKQRRRGDGAPRPAVLPGRHRPGKEPAGEHGGQMATVLLLNPVFELLARRDMVRSMALVCRDLASCVVALGLRADDPATQAVWSKLAETLPPDAPPTRPASGAASRFARTFSTTPAVAGNQRGGQAAAGAQEPNKRRHRRQQPAAPADEAGPGGGAPAAPLARVKGACAGDPTRVLTLTQSEAREHFKLTNRDLEVLPHEFGKYARKLYKMLDVQAVAHRKWGDEAGVLAAKARTRERGERARRAHAAKVEQRSQALARRLDAEGISHEVHTMPQFRWRITTYLRNGSGLEDLVVQMHAVAEERAARAARRAEAEARLIALDIPPAFMTDARIQEWVHGATGDLDAVVAGVAVNAAVQRRRQRRQRALEAALAAEGLYHLARHPTCFSFVEVDVPAAAVGGNPVGGAGAGAGAHGAGHAQQAQEQVQPEQPEQPEELEQVGPQEQDAAVQALPEGQGEPHAAPAGPAPQPGEPAAGEQQPAAGHGSNDAEAWEGAEEVPPNLQARAPALEAPAAAPAAGPGEAGRAAHGREDDSEEELSAAVAHVVGRLKAQVAEQQERAHALVDRLAADGILASNCISSWQVGLYLREGGNLDTLVARLRESVGWREPGAPPPPLPPIAPPPVLPHMPVGNFHFFDEEEEDDYWSDEYLDDEEDPFFPFGDMVPPFF